MLWITKKTIRINRSATAWLIRRATDPDVWTNADSVTAFHDLEAVVR